MISLKDVAVKYGSTIALHPTTISFKQGNFTVLLGASGAGKSTLLRSLNMMQPLESGSITIDGMGAIDSPKKLQRHRRQTGMIFQQHQLIGRQSVIQNVLLGRMGYHSSLRSLFPLSRQEQMLALQSLDRVGLLHKAMERVDQLSGGQQQRVGIARALVQQPRLILADEPVASLDPATADKVMTLLHTICKEDGISAVVSLHQVELARRYADRIIGLAQGKIVCDVAPAMLTQENTHSLYHQSTHIQPVSSVSQDRSKPPLIFNAVEEI